MEKQELIEVLIAMKEARKKAASYYTFNTAMSTIEVALIDAEIQQLKSMQD